MSNTSTMHLEAMPLDIGYASEKVTLTNDRGEKRSVGGQNGKTQLIVTTPVVNDALVAQLSALEKDLPADGEAGVSATLIVAGDQHNNPGLARFEFLIDSDEAFADWYGVRLSGAPLEGEMTKALFIISKDGALYYDEFAKDIDDPFNAETAIRKIYAALECYTGKGCH